MLEISSTLLQTVRATCADVARHARSVRIEVDAIAAYAKSLQTTPPGRFALDPKHHYLGHGDETVTFILSLDAINFGAGYFPHLERLDGLSGYFTVAHHLTSHFRENGPFGANELSSITPQDCGIIFGQTTTDPDRAELMRLFASALNELGDFVQRKYAGSFTMLVEDADHSSARLVAILVEMLSFRDVAQYRGRPVAFLKRAQLAASDLNLAFDHRHWGAFADLPCLTVFADNTLPHVLRTDGVLRYSSELSDRIDRGDMLIAGSEEEVEIRACTVTACEQIAAFIRQGEPGFFARDLDYILWNRGQTPRYKVTPSHRCKTIFY